MLTLSKASSLITTMRGMPYPKIKLISIPLFIVILRTHNINPALMINEAGFIINPTPAYEQNFVLTHNVSLDHFP